MSRAVHSDAAIYARVSTEEQGNKYSIDAQLDLCRQYASGHGLTVVREYREIGESGTKKHRPRLDAMLAAAKEGAFGVVLVWALDRLARGGVAYYFINEQLTAADCALVFVKDGENKFAGLLAWIGEQEVQAFKERAIAGRQRKAREGKLNPPPWSRFGYDYDEEHQRFVINPTEANWVRVIFAWHVDGAGARVITNRLRAKGVPTRLERWVRERLASLDDPSWRDAHHIADPVHERDRLLARLAKHHGWQDQTVHAILRATEYYGDGFASKSTTSPTGRRVERPKDEWIIFAYPAIIDKAVFDAAQAITQRLKYVRTRPNDKPQFMLHRLLWCEECQRWFETHYKQDSKRLVDGTLRYYQGKGRRHYLCSGMRRHPAVYNCRQPASLHADRIEQAVWSKLRAGLENPDLLLAGLVLETEAIETAVQSAADDIDATKRRLSELHMQEQRLLTVFRTGLIGEAALGVQLAVIKEQREALEEQLLQYEARLTQHVEHDDLVRRVLAIGQGVAALPHVVATMTPEQYLQASDIVRLVVERIRVDGGNHVAIDLVIGEVNPDASSLPDPSLVSCQETVPSSWC